MNKQQLRDAVRNQLDVDEEELPNGRLDLYLQAAFQRTIGAETNWPFLEFEWDLTVLEGEPIAQPIDCAAISTIYLYGYEQLQFLDHGFAEQNFGRDGTLGAPIFYSVRNSNIYLWPAPSAVESDILITGWRKPSPFLDTDAAGTPDCDERLHLPLIWYACSLTMAYDQEEVMQASYKAQWQDEVQAARDDIMRPSPGRARILNGGVGKARRRWGPLGRL